MTADENGVFPWLAGVDLNKFPGSDWGTRVSQAARSIQAATLSPVGGILPTPGMFTNKEMVDEAHKLGLTVVPWTVSQTHLSEARVLNISR